MKTAIDGAVKWLTEKTRTKTMAYSFFKSAQGGVLPQGLHKIRRKASALLEEINVERTT